MADAGKSEGGRTDKDEMFRFLVRKIREIMSSRADRDEKLKTICKLLKDNISCYNWVGFYIVDSERRNELVLGPFEGEPTEHTRIPFGKGICGQAAERRKTFLVQDISKETNYLSCSTNVKSEIVIPIFSRGEVVGELDIDSHSLSPFSKEDEAFLKKIGKMASTIF
jgi:L-methionine (R)-S-oxide reductase